METWQRGYKTQVAQATPSAQRPCQHRWVSREATPLPRLLQVPLLYTNPKSMFGVTVP